MGRYVDEILQPGEKVLYSTNEHWMFFLPAIAAWIVAVEVVVLPRQDPRLPLMFVCLGFGAGAAVSALVLNATALVHPLSPGGRVHNKPVLSQTGLIKP